ncbi:hypothetical protein A3709_18915 [Halioglobus sp. HI00S01]|nr:hypothetical protein A3709_18915 [Halioglobus sp. HI00S01]
MRGELRIFTKSMNPVLLGDQITETDWEVQRHSGPSKGKQMICRASALQPLDTFLEEHFGGESADDFIESAVDSLARFEWPVILVLRTKGRPYSLNAAYSGLELGRFSSVSDAESFCAERRLRLR